jgi:hypothetical protein
METLTRNISNFSTTDMFIVTLLTIVLVGIMIYIHNDDSVV